MEFKNYLKILSNNEYVNNQSPICIWGLQELISQMYIEIKENYKHSLLDLISSNLEIKCQDCRTFYQWKTGESPIPILKFFKFVDLWRFICKKSNEESDKIVQQAFIISSYFSTKRGKKINLPKYLTPELAYLIGFISGDGYLLDPIKEKETTGDFEFRIEITDQTNYTLKKYINSYFKEIFGIEGKYYVYKNRNAYEYYISSKVLFLFIHKVCELPKGKKGGKLHVPKIICLANKNIKAHYLGGFFDSDGFITTNKKIGFGLGKRERRLLEHLKNLFNELNINTRTITKFKNKRLKTWGWETSISWNSLLNFINTIPCYNFKKSKRLNKLKQNLMQNVNS